MNIGLNLFFYLRVVFVFFTMIGLALLHNYYNLIHFIPVVFIEFLSLVYLKLRKRKVSIVSLTKVRLVCVLIFFMLMCSVGFMAGYDNGSIFDGFICLWFYASLAVGLLGVIMPAIILSDMKSGVINFPSSGMSSQLVFNHADGHMTTRYVDYDLIATDSDTYWYQSPHYTASSIDSSTDVNPASGLIMIDDAIDVAGNFYGFNDHSFSNDNSHISQFSDYDYHNNN